MELNTLKQTFMVCATYRNEDKPSPLRYFGILNLIEDAKAQKCEEKIRLAIIDSSLKPHPFFTDPQALLADHSIAYIHIPDRSEQPWRRQFSCASSFIPTDAELSTPIWKSRFQNMLDWDDYLLLEDDFRKAYKGPLPSAFMHMARPTIGMKKNTGIAALTETFGNANSIIFCDDDDRHHPDYVSKINESIQDNDFARLGKWLTLVIKDSPEKSIWGMYDVPFYLDSNGNWRAPANILSQIFHSSLKNLDGSEVIRTIGSKFSAGMCSAFPPLALDGALHAYNYDTWGKSVKEFGGCSPTSMGEDMLFYRMCKDRIPDFKAVRVDSDLPLFIRCADGSNASLIEWNIELPLGSQQKWPSQVAADIYRNISSRYTEGKVALAGEKFLSSGKIDWDLIFN